MDCNWDCSSVMLIDTRSFFTNWHGQCKTVVQRNPLARQCDTAQYHSESVEACWSIKSSYHCHMYVYIYIYTLEVGCWLMLVVHYSRYIPKWWKKSLSLESSGMCSAWSSCLRGTNFQWISGALLQLCPRAIGTWILTKLLKQGRPWKKKLQPLENKFKGFTPLTPGKKFKSLEKKFKHSTWTWLERSASPPDAFAKHATWFARST